MGTKGIVSLGAAILVLCLGAAALAATDTRRSADDKVLIPAGRTRTLQRSAGAAYDGVVVLRWFRIDDFQGDHDGYPDTNETFDIRISVSNKSATGLSNVKARVLTSDPRIDCIVQPIVVIGNLPAGADIDPAGAFRLHVHPRAERGGNNVTCMSPGPSGTCSNFVAVAGGCSTDLDCRRSALDDYAVDLAVVFSSDQFAQQARPQSIHVDLDLDAQQPAMTSTTFVEGFESGLANLVYQNFDDSKATNALSDPYRCQYSAPSPNPSSECWMGSTLGQDPVNDWHVHDPSQGDGRAYAGVNSLHYGRHLGDPALDTYSFSQMDAIRTKSNINLAARICGSDPSPDNASCRVDSDCASVGGGPCIAASPELSFAHQVSLGDGRIFGAAPNETLDRAIVQVQVAGTPDWITVAPFENLFDVRATAQYVNCMFDPIDDGNGVHDLYAGTDPSFPLGPSSSCFPQYVFAYLGDTGAPFNVANIGRASDGPGLPGALGIGTWVRSRFDLSEFRGRSIKLRFLVTSIDNAANGETYQNVFHWYAEPIDDGWYIDDVRITQSLGSASATLALDTTDNSALPGNADGDARGDACDCAPNDPTAFAIPLEIQGLAFDSDKVTIRWASAVPSAGSGTTHQVLRGAIHELPVGSGASEACIASSVAGGSTSDTQIPASSTGFWYLVRGT